MMVEDAEREREIWHVLVAKSRTRGKPVTLAEHSNKQIFVASYV